MEIADKLYCFHTTVISAPVDADELFSVLEANYSSWEDLENHTFVHTFYSATPAERDALADAFNSARAIWQQEMDCEITAPEFFELQKEDWAEAWKKYFHPIEISDRLLILPSWLENNAKPGQKTLIIDPGMSFGTGQHATTLYCLQCIDRLAAANEVDSMLDAGCGSGILSIAGALSGIPLVEAFDNDPDAVRIAAENIALNHCDMIVPFTADAAVHPGRKEQYDLVCANILGHLLIKFRHNIVRWVRPGKYLVLAGILNQEFDEVSAKFCELGFEELDRNSLREWTGGLFRKL